MHKYWILGTFLAAVTIPALPQTNATIGRAQAAQAIHSLFRTRQAVYSLVFSEQRAAAEKPEVTLALGGGYSDNGNGNTATTTPAELRIDFPDQVTTIQLDGDLYDRIREGGATAKGHGDPVFTLLRKFPINEANDFIGGIGVSLPTGSPAGSTSASQNVTVVYQHDFANDAFSKNSFLESGSAEIWAIVGHDDGAFPPGVESVDWTGKAYYYQSFSKTDDVFVVVARNVRPGGGGSSTLGLGADFLIPGTEGKGPFKNVTGSLTGTCGISAGNHCGSIELDIQFHFK